MHRFRIAVICFLFLVVTSLAFAGEIDILIQKLVEKGVLTESEAKAVLTDTKASVAKQLAEGKLDTVPAWVQNTKWAGDFRLRWENRDYVQRDEKTNHVNVRLRYGFVAKVNDEINAGARLATGSNTNQGDRTQLLNNAFEKKSVWLDLMYLDYSPRQIKGLKLIGGKFSNPFYQEVPSGLFWGPEINPEGVAGQYKRSIKLAGYPMDLFANVGALPLDEASGGNISQVLYAMQGGGTAKVFDRMLKAAVAYYCAGDLKGATYANVSTAAYLPLGTTNTLTAGTTFTYDYRILALDAEYPIVDIKLNKMTLPLVIYGGLLKNVAQDVEKDEAWLAGFKLGALKDPKSWSFTYDYRRIARDAALDFITGGAFAGSGTNYKGHTFTLTYMPLKNTTLGFNYFKTQRVQGLKALNDYNDIMQLECVVKF